MTDPELRPVRTSRTGSFVRIAVTFASLVLASAAGAKDLIVHQRSSATIGSSMPREETVYLAGDKIVTDSTGARTIVDLQNRTITTADKAKRIYTVTTFDELHAQMELLKRSVEKLEPEARAQLGGMFDDDVTVTLTPTGRSQKLAGHSAQEYAVAGGPYSGSVWFTTEIATPEEFKRWKRVEQEGSGAAQRLGEALARIDGVPVKMQVEVKTGARTMQLSNEVLEVREGSPTPDLLAVPPGFTKQAKSKPAGA